MPKLPDDGDIEIKPGPTTVIPRHPCAQCTYSVLPIMLSFVVSISLSICFTWAIKRFMYTRYGWHQSTIYWKNMVCLFLLTTLFGSCTALATVVLFNWIPDDPHLIYEIPIAVCVYCRPESYIDTVVPWVALQFVAYLVVAVLMKLSNKTASCNDITCLAT